MRPSLVPLLRAGAVFATLLAAGLLLRWLAPHLLHHADLFARRGPASTAATLRAAAVLVALGALACALGLPRQAVCFAAGLGFGPIAGTSLALLATVIGCVADFLWARLLGRDWARRVTERRGGRLRALDLFLRENPFTSVLTLRLLPVGSSLLVSLLSGLAGINLAPFLAATVLGALPQTLVFCLLGSGVGLGRIERILIATALFVVSGLFGALLMRRHRRRLAALEAGPAAGPAVAAAARVR